MRTFDFYEFTGILIPGSIVLVSLRYLLNLQALSAVLAPESFGGLGMHLIFAYAAGHLVAAVGNFVEAGYWKLWKGMPTDWAVTRPQDPRFKGAVSAVYALVNQTAETPDVAAWRRLVAQARSTVYATGKRAVRVQFFNGNYGMFRGLLAAEGIICIAGGWAPMNHGVFYKVMALIIFLTGYRMHRFGVHYAAELFANVKELVRTGSKESPDLGRRG